MKLFEALRKINFKIGTLDDITGRAINNIIETRFIIDELNTQMFQYANKTKGICDTYSTVLNYNEPIIQAPKNALRSESYIFGQVIVDGKIFPLDVRGTNNVLNNFTINPYNGITSWLMPFGQGKNQYLGAFPTNSTSASVTKLTKEVRPEDTTIEVESTKGFIRNFGRLSVGYEKILYQSCDDTHFYGCIRGIEGTEAGRWSLPSNVGHCNLIIYYARLPEKIVVQDDNFVSQETLNKELEIVEEHMEGIIKIVAYNLILKLDNTRASQYKIDSEELFSQYEADIRKGYSKIRKGANVRSPYASQNGYQNWTNLQQ
ncbi:MAG: hypothetical protein K5622_07320 [Endomicrobiaceae bacterium]|nr:hypothetical protein [Endomicrobiaceae bacterium]